MAERDVDAGIQTGYGVAKTSDQCPDSSLLARHSAVLRDFTRSHVLLRLALSPMRARPLARLNVFELLVRAVHTPLCSAFSESVSPLTSQRQS